MPYVYILKSLRDNRYYIGSTTNIEKRFQGHLSGNTHTTRRFGSIEIALVQEYHTIAEARSVEIKLKKLKRHDYIEKIIKEKFIKIRP